jgi:RNA polymerase primary sigma factor
VNKIKRASAEFEQRNEREPTDEELAEVLEMSITEISNAMNYVTKQVSLDAPIGDDEDSGTLLDVLENQNSDKGDQFFLDKDSLRIEIERTLNSLNHREGQVIKMSFGLGGYEQHSLDEIAEYMNLTRERVRQIREKALRRLRFTSRSKLLSQFL